MNNMHKVIECVPNFSEGQRKEVKNRENILNRFVQRRFLRLSIRSHMPSRVSKALLYSTLIQVYRRIERFTVSRNQIEKQTKNKDFLLAFVGHPQAVIEAALAAGRSAYNLIDMTRHTGEHPRIGAMVKKPV